MAGTATKGSGGKRLNQATRCGIRGSLMTSERDGFSRCRWWKPVRGVKRRDRALSIQMTLYFRN